MPDYEMMTEAERALLTSGHCPACKERGFVLGPKGGVAQNIECASLACRARFNVTSFGGDVLMAQPIPRESEGGSRWPSAPHEGTFS
jgi:hypothetical protein